MVVVLAHIGGYWPNFEEGIADLACGLDADEVDLIVSGHTHSRIDDVMCGIPVVQAYSRGTAFARVDFTVDEKSGEVVDYEMNYSPTSTYQTYYGDPAAYRRWDTGEWVEVVPDPEVEAIVDYYEAQIEDVKNEVVGETIMEITRNYRYESAMGDWVTDIMRAYDTSIDFAFTNSGGLRADIDAGEITFGEVFEALPFDNTQVLVELDGSEVRQVLEEGITGDHGVIQVSGLQFTFDYDAPVGSRIVGDVIDLSTGLPLDSAATYYVAVNDFMANGGDDYDTLAANPQVNTYVLVRDIVVDWIKAKSPFAPPDPAVEQRITASGTPPS
jgi:2',3'-cyclic-nucleotide 2'-phosphodiesterase (5'-nucleotidase family)